MRLHKNIIPFVFAGALAGCTSEQTGRALPEPADPAWSHVSIDPRIHRIVQVHSRFHGTETIECRLDLKHTLAMQDGKRVVSEVRFTPPGAMYLVNPCKIGDVILTGIGSLGAVLEGERADWEKALDHVQMFDGRPMPDKGIKVEGDSTFEVIGQGFAGAQINIKELYNSQNHYGPSMCTVSETSKTGTFVRPIGEVAIGALSYPVGIIESAPLVREYCQPGDIIIGDPRTP